MVMDALKRRRAERRAAEESRAREEELQTAVKEGRRLLQPL